MAKCWKCNRQDLLQVGSKSGLCIDCLDIAYETATETMKKLSRGGEERAEVLAQIDALKASEVAQKTVEQTKTSPFAHWDVSVHSRAGQLGRIRRSASVKIISFDSDTQTAIVAGSKGTYTTSFTECSCGDFLMHQLPCKHMYRLAALYGGMDFSKQL